jgi:hypothetical protein
MSEFKPGDVALLTDRDGESCVGVCYLAGDGCESEYAARARWATSNRDEVWSSLGDVRRLVVIDPEDAEQAKRLLDILSASDLADDEPIHAEDITEMQAVLREYANPTPRIVEPQGLGVVVNDRDGDVWVKHLNGSWSCLMGPVGADVRTWDELCDQYGPISEGVTP